MLCFVFSTARPSKSIVFTVCFECSAEQITSLDFGDEVHTYVIPKSNLLFNIYIYIYIHMCIHAYINTDMYNSHVYMRT